MSILDIVCKNSISYSKDCCKTENCCLLYLGGSQNFISCLYFDLPTNINIEDIKNVKLILFKYTFIENSQIKYCRNKHEFLYCVAPLLDFFSPFSCQYSLPKADYKNKSFFTNNKKLSYIEIDITEIVKSWMTNKIENRGLLLVTNNNYDVLSFVSEKTCMPKTQPFIRLILKNKINNSKLKSIPCKVNIRSH